MKPISFKNRLSFSFTSSRLAVPLVIACLVGCATGLVVVGFIKLIHFSESAFFGFGKESLSFLGRYAVVLIPCIGGLLVGPIVTFMAPEAKGHGVPEVMKAIVLKGGKIRPMVVFAKALASAIAIGSGASAGREGPIVQIGSALGSSTGQFFKFSESRVKNLVACGAAAGISGVFNTPIAGVMFALEVILRDFGARALSTVVVSAVSASVISRMFLGDSPAFVAPSYMLVSPFEMGLYLGLGILSALTAWLFIRVLHHSEITFEKWNFPDWLKPAVGGLLIGCVGLYFPQVFGSGLHTIEQAIHGELAFKLLVALIFLKIIATSFSLGSGSSGGVFAPGLFIGAVLGGAYGKLFYERMPFPVAPPGAYAMVGMASVFAGAAHAPVTAILIVFEMTGDYQMILPLMVTTVMSVSLAQLISRESIYTIKLKDRGIDIDSIEEVKVLGALQVRDAMSQEFIPVSRKTGVKDLIEQMSQNKDKTFFVTNSKNEVLGYVRNKDVQDLLMEKDLGLIITDDVMTPLSDFCFPDEALSEAAMLMSAHHLTQIPVMDPTDPKKMIGIIRSSDIFNSYTKLSVKRNELVSSMEQEGSHSHGTKHVRFLIPIKSDLVGRTLKEIDIPDGVVLTSIERGRSTHVPEGGTVLKARDKVWAVVHPTSENEFNSWIRTYKLEKSMI